MGGRDLGRSKNTVFLRIEALRPPTVPPWRQNVTLKYLPENESPGEPRPYPDLPPGRYRLVKRICGPPMGCRDASVEFEIEE